MHIYALLRHTQAYSVKFRTLCKPRIFTTLPFSQPCHYLFTYLFIYLFIQFIYLFIHSFIYLFIHLFIYLFIHSRIFIQDKKTATTYTL